MRYIKPCAAGTAAIPLLLLAFQKGAPVKTTGAPVDGGQDCAACHGAGPANTDPRGSVIIENLQPYVPSVAQSLRVTIKHPEGTRWGFQMTARFVTDPNQMAGSFDAPQGDTQVVCDSGPQLGTPAPCTPTQTQFIEHSTAPTTQPGGGYSFSVQWTPPAQENGDLIFYLSAVAGGAALSTDHVYTISIRIPLSPNAACSITKTPTLRTAVNAGPHAGPITSNGMVEIYGADFQAGSRSRLVGLGDLGSGSFPTELSCIAVEIGGKRAPITYIQQDQINVQTPTLDLAGNVNVVVFANPGRPNELRTGIATVPIQGFAPAFFTFGNTKSIAAQIGGTATPVADPSVVAGGRPAAPGEIVSLYGTGFGPSRPAWQAGQLTSGLSPLTMPYTVRLGSTTLITSDILYGGVAPQAISGLYQFNVRIPANAPNGNLPVSISIGGQTTQDGVYIPILKPVQ
jgi:uncharacterized protein (TIGR03437 family)